ncbi:MAG: BatD family protein [Deltaproteobacteria bacterium]|jgi:tetratricopeptide (TPR) repeat protein|nr:BatD family protein [Deltaproteobacteria bacterium]
MNLKKIPLIIIVLFISMPGLCSGFEVTAHVDKSRISQDDSILFKVEVNGGTADLDISVIQDFKVISRGTSSSLNYINGKSERKASYRYILLPLSKGRLKIPAIKITRRGQTAFTKEIIINVADQVVEPAKVKALFARAFVPKNQFFTGEQIVFTLQFFTSRRLSGVGFEKPLEFKGFSSKPFEEEKTYTQNINGVRFNVTQVNYILTPSNPGIFTVSPAVLIARVVVRSKFNDSFFLSDGSKPVRVVSNPVEIEIMPLPQYHGDGKFSGLVGNFDIISNMDQTNLNAGESATLTIKISGTGNIMDASLPKINFDDLYKDAFKIYDDNPVETIELTQHGYRGFKIFKKAIVPVNAGKYTIKPVTLIYFDVDKKGFKSVSTEPLSLDVTPSEKTDLAVKPLNLRKEKSIVKKEVSLVNRDILEIKEGLKVLEDYNEINPLLFVILLSIPAVVFSGIKIFTVVWKKELSIEKQMEEKAKFHLKQAGKLNSQGKDFLSHLYSSLVSSILAKGEKRGETVTLKEAQVILEDAGVNDKTAGEITTLLESIESVRFGGKILDENRAKDLLSKTKQLIKMLCITLICFGVFTFVPQKAVADSTETFIDALKDYKAGDFKQSARKFETIAQKNIKNPYLYYNIGNAYLKAKDTGHAILWYERAKILAPGDPDLNYNLEYANSLVRDKKEDSIKIMEILFFWDSLIPVKTVQITAVFFSSIFFTWAAIQAVRRKKVFSGFGIMFFSIFILTAAMVFVNYYKQSVRLNAVIVTKEAVIRSGMADTSTKLFSLHAGTKIRVVERRDGYLKIKFSKGKIGWIKTGQAVII